MWLLSRIGLYKTIEVNSEFVVYYSWLVLQSWRLQIPHQRKERKPLPFDGGSRMITRAAGGILDQFQPIYTF